MPTGDAPQKEGWCRSISRRTVLGTSAAIASGAVLGHVSAQPDDITVLKLRGSYRDPLSIEELDKSRANELSSFVNAGGDLGEYGLKELDSLPGHVDLVAYNLVIDADGSVAENYVERVKPIGADNTGIGTSGLDETATASKADELLEETITKLENRDRRSVTNSGADHDFDELQRLGGGSDVSIWSEQAHYGNVKRMHEVRSIPGESDQYAVRAGAKMNSGYNLCKNRNNDEYCTTGRPEYRNRNCEIEVDWGDGRNVGADDVAPQNEIADGTTVTFGGAVTNDSVGANYSYSESANTLAETSDTSTGIAAHRVRLKPATVAGRTIAQFQSYSAGERAGSCFGGKKIVEITVDPTWDRPVRPYRLLPYWNRTPRGTVVKDTLGHYCGG
ncbi:hypothetical protein [Halovivax sp.]|uniref:hypothetical protein n=1 Tax=Halovivax sp. TaxID=1935978 RepID=UPI0025C5A0EF|nr:hypothetical protein [Halovivax sp.]